MAVAVVHPEAVRSRIGAGSFFCTHIRDRNLTSGCGWTSERDPRCCLNENNGMIFGSKSSTMLIVSVLTVPVVALEMEQSELVLGRFVCSKRGSYFLEEKFLNTKLLDLKPSTTLKFSESWL